MKKGYEQSPAAASARKDLSGTKKTKERPDTETSSDSEVDRTAEAEAKRKENKCRLTEVELDDERVDCMIAEAEAKNQARLAKLAEVSKSYQVI
jgi:hypothetical protein